MPAMASSKICFGSSKDEDTNGVVITAEINKDTISIRTREGEFYNGTYPSYKSIVKGADGKLYHEYKGANYYFQEVIMVDELLLHNKSTGLIQFRTKGESGINYSFECHDTRY